MKKAIRSIITSERGDTNMTTVIILICIILALAALYRFFVENGWNSVRIIFNSFLKSLGI